MLRIAETAGSFRQRFLGPDPAGASGDRPAQSGRRSSSPTDIAALLTFAARVLPGFRPRLVSSTGVRACLGALVVLVIQLSIHDRATLLLIGASMALVSALRPAAVWRQHCGARPGAA
jgi:hypothetical protein